MSVFLRSLHPGPTTTVAPMAADAKPAPPEPLFSPRHVTAGALALGAVAAGVTGAFFALESNRDKDSASALRVGLATNVCTHAAATGTCAALGDKVNAQHQEMTVAAALFAGAAGLAAGGIVTWLLWPRSQAHPSGWVAPTRGGATVQVGGDFNEASSLVAPRGHRERSDRGCDGRRVRIARLHRNGDVPQSAEQRCRADGERRRHLRREQAGLRQPELPGRFHVHARHPERVVWPRRLLRSRERSAAGHHTCVLGRVFERRVRRVLHPNVRAGFVFLLVRCGKGDMHGSDRHGLQRQRVRPEQLWNRRADDLQPRGRTALHVRGTVDRRHGRAEGDGQRVVRRRRGGDEHPAMELVTNGARVPGPTNVRSRRLPRSAGLRGQASVRLRAEALRLDRPGSPRLQECRRVFAHPQVLLERDGRSGLRPRQLRVPTAFRGWLLVDGRVVVRDPRLLGRRHVPGRDVELLQLRRGRSHREHDRKRGGDRLVRDDRDPCPHGHRHP